MKPYGNIRSKNLSIMLFLARLLAYLAVLALIGGIGLVSTLFSSPAGVLGASFGLALIPVSLTLLLFSSLLAAITAFEDNYRKRTEHIVNKN